MNILTQPIEKRIGSMPIGKLGQRRQVVIPKDICDALGLNVGDYVEVNRVKSTVVIKPKKLVDADDVLTPEEEAVVKKGVLEKRGQIMPPPFVDVAGSFLEF